MHAGSVRAAAQFAVDAYDVGLNPAGGFAIDFEHERGGCAARVEPRDPAFEFRHELVVRATILLIRRAAYPLHVRFLAGKMIPRIAVQKHDHLHQAFLAGALMQRIAQCVQLRDELFVIIVDDGMARFEGRTPSDHFAPFGANDDRLNG